MTHNEIAQAVHDCYWDEDLNCATTALVVLSQAFSLTLDKQVVDSALGMHGAACFGAQCGLVEGPLLFLGIYGRHKGWDDDAIRTACYNYAYRFQREFGSLLCSRLRPGGFSETDPEHLCEDITAKAVAFAVDYLEETPSRNK